MKENEAEAERTNVYWHQAAKGQLGNFVTEELSGGRIARGEEPLQFENHIFNTSDETTIAFIEKSSSYKNGTVIKCKDMATALEKTRALNRTRGGIRTIESVVNITPSRVKVDAQ